MKKLHDFKNKTATQLRLYHKESIVIIHDAYFYKGLYIRFDKFLM